MLAVDLGSGKIKKVETSSDWIPFQYQTGAKLVFQKYKFPACLCQDPIPSIDANGNCIAS
jgi:hypothetical protein